MQPPDLKGGGRSNTGWSCYDPTRPEKEDYDKIQMPSKALDEVIFRDMLEPETERKFYYF